MKARAYYNEINPYAAQWLRNLILAGVIADGDVDERSIEDVKPYELTGYTQCHFFAGIGVWSYALRQAGWADNRRVWTGSCPCQPFSAAGKGDGVDDERHLWPAWQWLIQQCQPDVIFGEQVKSAIQHSWLDLVQSDLEGLGYTVAPFVLPACGFGAPHIRERLFFVADSKPWQLEGRESQLLCRLGDTLSEGLEGHTWDVCDWNQSGRFDEKTGRPTAPPGLLGGFWKSAGWLPFTDGKVRPVEPGTPPLAYGTPSDMELLQAYGNGIVAPVASAFIKSFMEVAV